MECSCLAKKLDPVVSWIWSVVISIHTYTPKPMARCSPAPLGPKPVDNESPRCSLGPTPGTSRMLEPLLTPISSMRQGQERKSSTTKRHPSRHDQRSYPHPNPRMNTLYPKELSLRTRPPVCTAPWRVGFEQRLRYLLNIPGAVLPALNPLSLPKPPPGGTENPWQLWLWC